MLYLERIFRLIIFMMASLFVVVRADVRVTVAGIQLASAKEIAETIENAVLQRFNEQERNQIANLLVQKKSNAFSGYVYYRRALTDTEYQPLTSHYALVGESFLDMLSDLGSALDSADDMLYKIVNKTSNEVIGTTTEWSRLAFSNDESWFAQLIKKSHGHYEEHIEAININSANREKITIAYPANWINVNNLAFTHDNNYLIIATHVNNVPQIYVYDLLQRKYCDVNENSYGASLLGLNQIISSENFEYEDPSWDSPGSSLFKVTTSPCGRHLACMIAQASGLNTGVRLCIYHIDENRLQQIFDFDYADIDKLPVSSQEIRKKFTPKRVNCCFSDDGNFVALRCLFGIYDYAPMRLDVDDRYKPATVAIFESASGECDFLAKIDERRTPIDTLKLNNHGSMLVANVEDNKSLVWEHINIAAIEQDNFDLNKALFVYMLSKWPLEENIDFSQNQTLIEQFKKFAPVSQLLLQQKYNIVLSQSYLKRLWNNVASCAIM